MSEAIYTQRDGLLVPSGHARGPWDPNSQHGGGPAALLVRAVEQLEAPGPMLLARLTVEFLGAVPLAPMEVRAEIVRPGRRLQLAEASIVVEGKEVCRARASRLRRAAVTVPDGAIPEPRIPGPDGIEPHSIPLMPDGLPEGFAPTAMELRFTDGAFAERGPSTAWFRLSRPLVEAEEPTATQRVAAAADFGNGTSSELNWDHHLFVNTDLTFHLSREPEGEWIAVEARTEHGPEGTALARSTLHDLRGPVGVAAQSLYVAPR